MHRQQERGFIQKLGGYSPAGFSTLKKIHTNSGPSPGRATYAVTSSIRRLAARALWTRVTLEVGTPAQAT